MLAKIKQEKGMDMAMIAFMASIISIGALISRIFDTKIEESIAPAMFLIILLLYISGLVTNFYPGLYIVWAISSLCGIIFIYNAVKDRGWFQDHILTSGLAAFGLFAILFWWSTRGRVFSEWDEFSHWGLVIKNMYSFNDFGNVEGATTVYRGYPPASSILSYYYLKTGNCFTESYTLRAMDLFLISLLLPLFKNISLKETGKFLCTFAIVLFIPLCFDHTIYSSILVDGLLGLLYFYILYGYYTNTDKNFKIFSLCLAAFTISITKSSGLGLAIIAALILLVNSLIQNRGCRKNEITDLKTFAAIAVFALLGNYTWKLYLQFTETQSSWDMRSMTLNGILKLFTSQIAPYQKETIKSFITNMYSNYFSGGMVELSVVIWILIFILLLLLFCKTADKATVHRTKYLLMGVNYGMALYSITLLMLYLFTYSEYEAMNVASFARYMSTYLIGMLALYCAVYLEEFQKTIELQFLVIALLLNISWVQPIADLSVLAPQIAEQTRLVRKNYTALEALTAKLNPASDNLFFVYQNDKGFSFNVARYLVTPVPMRQSMSTWSLGKPYYDTDIWTTDFTPDEWSDYLLNGHFTFIYLYQTDDQFTSTYGDLFEDKDNITDQTLYKVTVDGHNRILLVKDQSY